MFEVPAYRSARLSLDFLLLLLFFLFLKSNSQNLKYFEFCLSAICEDAALHTQV